VKPVSAGIAFRTVKSHETTKDKICGPHTQSVFKKVLGRRLHTKQDFGKLAVACFGCLSYRSS
jgi:hypothetical protein